jgi:hypothetical protein
MLERAPSGAFFLARSFGDGAAATQQRGGKMFRCAGKDAGAAENRLADCRQRELYSAYGINFRTRNIA